MLKFEGIRYGVMHIANMMHCRYWDKEKHPWAATSFLVQAQTEVHLIVIRLAAKMTSVLEEYGLVEAQTGG